MAIKKTSSNPSDAMTLNASLETGKILNSTRDLIMRDVSESTIDVDFDHPKALHLNYDDIYNKVTDRLTDAYKQIHG